MKRLFVRLSLLSVLFLGSAFAAGPWVSVSDSVAGADLPVRVSGLLDAEAVFMVIVRPDDSKIDLKTTADEFGVVNTRIIGMHLRQAGEHALLVRREHSDYVISQNFLIAPAAVSAYRSTLTVENPSVAADGEHVSRIRLSVRDAHGNLITQAPVRAFSSRLEDSVVSAPQTNDQGEAIIKVTSAGPGVSTISVLVGDVMLSARAEVIFHLAKTGLDNVGASGMGKYLQAALFSDPDEASEVAYFSIEEIGSEVVTGKNLTVRIGAKDGNGDVVTNYTGTVRFSSSDDRAILPNDYAFSGEDQGWHTFYLSVMLQTPGMQTIAVHDLEDFRISGERPITVSDAGGVVAVPDPVASLTIDVPVNGATFSASRITISGSATGCSLVSLADGPIELIDELPVDASGTYVYQTPSLADGMHIFQATCVEDPTLLSNKVQITIDRSPPQVMSAVFEPAGLIAPGAEVAIKIGASDELSGVRCIFAGRQFELTATDSRNYAGVLRAPSEPGEYPMECTLADLLGNEMTEANTGVMTVGVPASEVVDPVTEPEISEENLPPLAVLNLQAQPGDDRATLIWSPAVDDHGIKQYKLEYGIEEYLDFAITPDPRTQWYVLMEECATYKFRVTAIDTHGLEGAISNEVISSTPCPDVEHPAPPKTGTGAQLWIIISSLLAGIGAVMILRRRA